VFTHGNNGNKEEHSWRCGGDYGFEVFMSFSFIWDVDVTVNITQRWLKCVARELPSKT
jgi:hypothetical protein